LGFVPVTNVAFKVGLMFGYIGSNNSSDVGTQRFEIALLS